MGKTKAGQGQEGREGYLPAEDLACLSRQAFADYTRRALGLPDLSDDQVDLLVGAVGRYCELLAELDAEKGPPAAETNDEISKP